MTHGGPLAQSLLSGFGDIPIRPCVCPELFAEGAPAQRWRKRRTRQEVPQPSSSAAPATLLRARLYPSGRLPYWIPTYSKFDESEADA